MGAFGGFFNLFLTLRVKHMDGETIKIVDIKEKSADGQPLNRADKRNPGSAQKYKDVSS